MDKLKKAYEAVEMLKALGLPISSDQTIAIAQMERQYLREEVIPLIAQEMGPLVELMQNKFNMEVTYSKEDGLDIQLVDKKPIQASLFPSLEKSSKRQRKYIIKVIFPDNHMSCSKMVWETLVDVVRYAGARKVMDLGISILGDNLVSSELHDDERYRAGQKEVEPGLYVCTYSSTDVKLEQIRKINKDLNLGLRVERIILEN
jgi:hypothetical protein